MKTIFLFALIFLSACSCPFVKTAAPAAPLDTSSAVRASGTITQNNFDFTLIAAYQGDKVRALVLAEPALKLADMTVYKDKTELHYKADKLPQKLLKIWQGLIRENLFTACPARQIIYSRGGKMLAQAEVTGGICP